MSYNKKFNHAMQELANTTIMKPNTMPPFMKLLVQLGFQIRPPHYASFGTNLGVLGTFFGGCFGLLMTLLVWLPQRFPFWMCIFGSVCAGLLFGLGMAMYYRTSARKHKLSKWEHLGETNTAKH